MTKIKFTHSISLHNIKARIVDNGINACAKHTTKAGVKSCQVKGYVEEGFLYLSIEIEDILDIKTDLIKQKLLEHETQESHDI